MTGKVDSVSHGEGQSTVKLQDSDATVSGTLVLDATGHSRRLVQFDKKFDPGYQGAYGIIAGAIWA
jgi:lycopene beta-cyclase